MRRLLNKEREAAAEETRAASHAHEPPAAATPIHRSILKLQRSHGNRFVTRMLGSRTAGANAAASASGAAGSAGAVIQRKCTCGGTCDTCRAAHEDGPAATLHPNSPSPRASELSPHAGPLAASGDTNASSGTPLDPNTRAAAEARFGQDFGDVRVHTDGAAARAAESLEAQAFTVGRDVFFGSGRYKPEAGARDPLLTHELVHVAQQRAGRGGIGADEGALEAQADEAERQAGTGETAEADSPAAADPLAAAPHVQRKAGSNPSIWERIGHGFAAVGRGIGAAAKAVGHGVATAATAVGSAVWKGLKWTGEKIAAGAEWVWHGLEWLGEQFWDKAVASLERVTQWVARLPERVARLMRTLWEGVKTLKPWSLRWWKSLFHITTWGHFLEWVLKMALDLAEVFGIPEILETAADLLKYNTRALTSSERGTAAGVFGASINLDLVRVDEYAFIGPLFTKSTYTTFHTINGWGGLKDFVLIHELVHVWQYERDGAIYMAQAVGARVSSGVHGAYDYKGVAGLQAAQTAGQGLASFNREQQASIVEDFYRIKTGIPARPGGGTSADLALYAHFVKEVSTLSEAQLLA